MKISILILVLFTGCSSSYQLATTPGENGISFEELQKAVEGEYTIITLKDSVIHGMIHHVRQDSIIYEESNTTDVRWKPPLHSVPFSQVSRIQYKDRLKGLAEWGAGGALVGIVAGTSIAAGMGGEPGWKLIAEIIGFGVGMVSGGLSGGIVSVFVGHNNEYRLWKESEVKHKE